VIPDTILAFQPIARKGPPPRSFAVDAHVCIMVWDLAKIRRIQGRGAMIDAAWRAPLRSFRLIGGLSPR